MQYQKMKKLSIAALSLLLFMMYLTACASEPTRIPPPDETTAIPEQYGSSAPNSQESQLVPLIIVLMLGAVGIGVVVGLQKRAGRIQNWRQLADELNAKYVEGGRPEIQLDYKQWTITLDVFNIVRRVGRGDVMDAYTRLRAPYADKDGFQFLLYRKSSSRLPPLAFQKMGEINTESAVLDDEHTLRATNPATVHNLLATPKIRECISQQLPILYRLGTIHDLSYKSNLADYEVMPDGVNEVYLELNGWISDIDQLESMVELVEEMLNQLSLLGVASEEKPNYTN